MMTERQRRQREQRRYRRLALRAASALPKRALARSGRPSWHFDWSFNSDDRAETAAAIRDLARAVRNAKPRRYFGLELPKEMEHAMLVTAKGRTLRLIRFFDVFRGKMICRLSVAGA